MESFGGGTWMARERPKALCEPILACYMSSGRVITVVRGHFHSRPVEIIL
jgi:hypothetical protein